MQNKTLSSFRLCGMLRIGAAALVLILLIPVTALATRPIGSGLTIDFAASSAVSGNTVQMRTVIAVDLDGDGDLDLITGRDSSTNEVRAWQNNGSPFGGAWSETQVGETGTATSALAAADLDHDGYVDLIAGGTDTNVYIFKGNSTPFTGPWGTSRDISASSVGAINGLAVADIDRDGDLDIISVHTGASGSQVSVWENPYDRSTNPNIFDENWMARTFSHTDPRTVNTVAVADIDRDGYPDLVAGYLGDTGAEVIVWENTYDATAWTFASHDVDSDSGTVYSVDVGDVDRDGWIDIVQCSSDEEVVVWENTYDATAWTFSEHVAASSLGDDVEAVALVDLDNDGYLDIAAGTGTAATYEVLAFGNDVDATFDWSFTQHNLGALSTAVMGLAVGDLDNDGDYDLATARDNAGTGEYEVAVWRNDLPHRNAPFDPDATTIDSTGRMFELATGDLDDDGNADIVSADQSDRVIAWRNDGTPFGSAWYEYIVIGSHTDDAQSVAIGDLDGDGDLDIVSGGTDYTIRIWQNDGTPFIDGWSGIIVGSHSDTVNSVKVGDLDGDGDLDIVSVGDDGQINIWQNDGAPFDNAWSSVSVGGSIVPFDILVLGDLDNDGDLDIVSGGFVGYEVVAWQNDGTPFDAGWNGVTVVSALRTVFSVAVGDLDNDGYLDIVTGSSNADSTTIWRNDGTPFDAVWSTSQIIGSQRGRVLSLAVRDLDRDSNLDIISSGVEGYIISWQNDGTPFDAAWVEQVLGGDFLPAKRTITVEDIDRDGDLDIVSGDDYGDIAAWTNAGGSAGFTVTDTAPDTIDDGSEDDVFQVVFTHNGIAADRNLELNYWNVDLLASDCNTSLSDAQANAIIANLHVRLDDGDGVFETDGSDVLVADVDTLTLTSGVQQVSFTNDNSNVQVSGTGSKTYWLSTLLTSAASDQSPNTFCLNVDPDADFLVEGKTPDFSVSIQDSGATNTGGIGTNPTAVTLASFDATPQDDAILVTWETASELDNVGFNLYRSEAADGPYTLLNDTLIPPQFPGEIMGGYYEWLDTDVLPGVTYYYKLEDIDVKGVSTFHGPVNTSIVTAPTAVGLRSVSARGVTLSLALGVTTILGVVAVFRRRR